MARRQREIGGELWTFVTNSLPSDTAALSVPVSLRLLGLLYGGGCYLIFLVVFLYAIGFVGNLLVPKSIDSGEQVSLAETLTVDLFLLSPFAVLPQSPSLPCPEGLSAVPEFVKHL
jgi:hypothetical protein